MESRLSAYPLSIHATFDASTTLHTQAVGLGVNKGWEYCYLVFKQILHCQCVARIRLTGVYATLQLPSALSYQLKMSTKLLRVKVEPHGRTRLSYATASRITNVAFGDDLVIGSSVRSALKIIVVSDPQSEKEDEAIRICELIEGRCEQITVDICIPSGSIVDFEVSGEVSLHLLGTQDTTRPPVHSAPPDSRTSESSVSTPSHGTVSGTSRETEGAPIDNSTAETQAKKRKREDYCEDDPTNSVIPAENLGSNPQGDFSMLDMHEASNPRKVTFFDIKQGDGEFVVSNSDVEVKYQGTLLDGTVWGRPRDLIKLKLGAENNGIIQGWERGMLGMREHGRRIIMVPPTYGYGDNERSGVPASSTLVIDCYVASTKTKNSKKKNSTL